MPTDRPELTRRRLLSGLVTIGAASGAAGVGTWAVFSDEERSVSTVVGGTVDVELASPDEDGSEEHTFTVADVEAGDEGADAASLWNKGTLPVTLGLSIDSIDTEGGAEHPSEESEGDSDHAEGDGSRVDDGHELVEHLTVAFGVSPTGDPNREDAVVLVGPEKLSTLSTESEAVYEISATLSPDDSTHLFLDWAVDRNAGKQIYGDVATMQLTVHARHNSND